MADGAQGEIMATKLEHFLPPIEAKSGLKKNEPDEPSGSCSSPGLGWIGYPENIITHMLRGTAQVADRLPDVWKIHIPNQCEPIAPSSDDTRSQTPCLNQPSASTANSRNKPSAAPDRLIRSERKF